MKYFVLKAQTQQKFSFGKSFSSEISRYFEYFIPLLKCYPLGSSYLLGKVLSAGI